MTTRLARSQAQSLGVRVEPRPLAGPGREPELPSPSLPWPQPARNQASLPVSRPGTARNRTLWFQTASVAADLLCVCVAAVSTFALRFVPGMPMGFLPAGAESPWHDQLGQYAGFLVLYGALVVLCCYSQGLYGSSRINPVTGDGWAVLKAVGLATMFLTAFIYLSGIKTVSRLVVVSSGVFSVFLLVAWRTGRRQLRQQRARRGQGLCNVLIVGAGKVGQSLARHLQENACLGYSVKGFIDRHRNGDLPVLGTIDELPELAQKHFVDEVFVTIPSERETVKRTVAMAMQNRLALKVVPEMYDGLAWNAPTEFVGDFPVRVLYREPIPILGLFVKRTLDVAFSAFALMLLAPLFALLAALIKLDSTGPVFYCAPRVGKKGKLFTCYKFRTMVVGADALKATLRQHNQRTGPFFKISNDPRITRVGRFLRKFSLDELPQLWNVLKGEMSLVGPRPHPLDDYEQYSVNHLRRLDVLPGLTGLWQIRARRNPSFNTSMALDLEYIESWSLWLDLKILFCTIPAVARGTGE
ncbi:MAG TPA: sugar transferase [Terriglobia bacterium]|nr:sugar transferase [Terriglobia bacterium]